MYAAVVIAVLSFAISETCLYSSDNVAASSDPSSFIDLEESAQDFVLESKQIFVEGHPTAFNPTIVRWNESLLMAFMIRDRKTRAVNGIGMAWLDDKFEVTSSVYELEVPSPSFGGPSRMLDPRLIVIHDCLYIVYSAVISGDVRRIFVAQVYFDGIRFYTDMPEGLFNFEGERESRWEKNWMPFEYKGELHFIYSLTPHKILKPIFGTNYCETIAVTKGNIDWRWGYPRGGSQVYCDGDRYLGFFHSSISIPTVHSSGKNIPHYFFGAYTFSLEPPFEITHISPEPIIGNGFYSGPPYKTWKPLRVVFPDGYVFDKEFIWVLYGKQDHEIWVVKLDRKALLDSLVPVEAK